MRNDERRAPLAERLEAVLNQRFAFAVEARGRFVEDQDARVRENGAGNRDALTLAARQLVRLVMQAVAQPNIDQRLRGAFFARFRIDPCVNEGQLDVP